MGHEPFPDDDLTFCALARMDSNECFGKNIDWDTAVDYCKIHNNDPCATYECPSKLKRSVASDRRGM